MNESTNSYKSTTIKSIIQDIYHRELLIPDFQRGFEWDHERIETLFDSIFKGYPIGTFLFWQNNDAAKFKLYDFIQDFSKFDSRNYGKEINATGESFKAVIDGQQRLTSLYIGFKGTYAYHTKYSRIYDRTGYPPKKLYFLYNNYAENEKLFNFMDPTHIKKEQDIIEVEDFLRYDSPEKLIEHIQEKDPEPLSEKAITAIKILYDRININQTISYYTISNEFGDEILDMFARVNTAGMPLSKSDLLMSLLTSNWKVYNAKDEFANLIFDVGKFGKPNFIINNSFILKCCLILSDSTGIRFELRTVQKNLKTIEDNWNDIKQTILSTFKILEECGFNEISAKGKQAIIPIAYWIHKKQPKQIDHTLLRKWLIRTYLTMNNISDGNLIEYRRAISEASTEQFPIEQITKHFRAQGINQVITDEYLEKLLASQYGSAQAWHLLLLLYPEIITSSYASGIDQDHMYPTTLFKERNLLKTMSPGDTNFALKHYNTVLNLQLLPTGNNKSKNDTDLETWHNQNPEYNLYVDEEISLNLKDFRTFIENRKQNIKKRLKEILQN